MYNIAQETEMYLSVRWILKANLLSQNDTLSAASKYSASHKTEISLPNTQQPCCTELQ
jgi:hypothetical protein